MQIVIDISEKLAYEGFERPFTKEEKSYSQKTLLTILEEHKDKNLRIFIGTRRRDCIPGIWRGYMDFLKEKEAK